VEDYLTEREQWERLVGWIKANGPWIIGGIALGAAVLVGWRWWEARQNDTAVRAAEQYQAVLEAFDKGDRTHGMALIAQLKEQHGSSPYADQADLIAARMFVESNELDKATERLRRVMNESDDRELALVARLRLARVQLAQNKPDDALATLNPADAGAFAPRYHEVRGDAYFAKGDKAAALREYEEARKNASLEVMDTQLLDLKIKDLSGGQPAPREPATAAAVESK
jgi:predicted negative regulator of RcsB-dependent stress response